MQTDNNKCKEIEFNLDAFHDGELSAAEHATVEQHLKACADCVAKLAEIDRVVHTLKTMPRIAATTNLSSKLDSIIDSQTKVVPLHRKVWKPAAAVAAAAALFLGIRMAMPGDSSSVPTVAQQPQQQFPTAATTSPIATGPSPTALSPAPTTIARSPTATLATKPPVVPAIIAQSPSTHSTPAPHTVPKQHPKQDEPVMLASRPIKDLHLESTPNTTTATAATDSEAIAELPTITDSFSEAIGLSTDEDGLYDIKM